VMSVGSSSMTACPLLDTRTPTLAEHKGWKPSPQNLTLTKSELKQPIITSVGSLP
jgi:hypothetical protein